jgi:hypothetical protein
MTRIIVHVDSLRLTGVRHADRHAFAAGLQDALIGALADADLLATLRASTATVRRDVGVVQVARDAVPAGVGASVGTSIGALIATGMAGRRTR